MLHLHVDVSAEVEANYLHASPGMPGGDYWRDDALMHHLLCIYGVWQADKYSRETIKELSREGAMQRRSHMEEDAGL